MKKILYSIFVITTICITLYNIIYNPYIINNTINKSISLFLESVFPSLFISLLISSLIIDLSINKFFGNILNKLFYKIFKINKESSFIFVLSFFIGSPSNAKYINDLFEKNIINEKEAVKLLIFSSFTNPIFIINTVGFIFLNNILYGYIIVITLLITNIVLGVINRNYYISKKEKNNNFLTSLKDLNKNINNVNIIDSLFKSFISTSKILINVFYIITISLLIINLISIGQDNIFNTLLVGLLEITSGLKLLSESSINIDTKLLLSTIIISFGGLSIHAQIYSIFKKKKVNYIRFLIFKILSIPISIIVLYIIKFIMI